VQLRDYIRIVAKRGWVILLAMFITTSSTLVFSKLQTPVYRSTIYLNVWPARLDWGLQQVIKALMRNYAGTIGSRDMASRVIDRLQLDITPTELQSKLTISPIESDSLLRIDANDYDPMIARDIAQTAAQLFVDQIKVYMNDQDKADRVEVTIRDYAEPGVLFKPKWKVNTLAGAVFGLLVGGLIVFILEWLAADIIRTPEDAERHTGIAVLGIIPLANAPTRGTHRSRHQTATSIQR
jgi:capsular polysaccharide biosynthesis protein